MKAKLTPELKEEIVKYIETGNYIRTACQAVGIGKTTHYIWMERGKKASELEEKGKRIPESEKIYRDYRDAIKKAKAKAVIRNVLVIQAAAKKSWQAAAWWLERAHFKDWGRKEGIGGIKDSPIKIEIKNKDLEKELRDKLDAISERMKKAEKLKKEKLNKIEKK